MGVEIERKFLLANNDWRQQVDRSDRLTQGYLSGVEAAQAGFTCSTVRVRTASDKAWLNIKSANAGLSRDEYEYPIPLEEADRLLKTLCRGVIEKIRHHVHMEGAHFEIDEFLGENQGLVVAEVELLHPDAPYPTPDWLGAEVSDDARYYNANLAAVPYASWAHKKTTKTPKA